MSVLRPMTDAEYLAWLAEVVPAYAKDKVASGAWPEAQSLALSKQAFDTLLPQGRATRDNFLLTVLDEGAMQVGCLWFAVEEKCGSRIAYVYDVSIKSEHQRKGYARRAFAALEQEAQRLGLAGIALHVFGHNTAARALYEQLGFQPTSINLYKPVTH